MLKNILNVLFSISHLSKRKISEKIKLFTSKLCRIEEKKKQLEWCGAQFSFHSNTFSPKWNSHRGFSLYPFPISQSPIELNLMIVYFGSHFLIVVVRMEGKQKAQQRGKYRLTELNKPIEWWTLTKKKKKQPGRREKCNKCK